MPRRPPTPILTAASTSGSSSDYDQATPLSPASITSCTGSFMSSRRYSRGHRRTHRTNSNASNNSRCAPNSVSKKITPLHAIPYVHGSYASASPAFVNNSKFCHVLRRLLPAAYDELKSLMKGSSYVRSDSAATTKYSRPDSYRSTNETEGLHETSRSPDPVKVMKWAENNPVVSAFGIWESDSGRRTVRYPSTQKNENNNLLDDSEDEYAASAQNAKATFRRRRGHQSASTFEIRPSHNKPALEWDVFVDPKLVRQVAAAMEVVEGLEWKINAARNKRARARQRKHENQGIEDDDEEYDLYQSHTAAQIEVDRLVTQLMKRMILAHGSMSQLVLEAFGIAKDYNYKSVVKGVRTAQSDTNRRKNKDKNELVWDDKEEERDYDTMLKPDTPKGETKKSFVGSRGIFMENWLSIFSQALTLLENNSAPEKAYTSKRENNNLRIETTQPAQIGQAQGLTGILGRMWFRTNSSFALPSPKPTEEQYGENDSQEVDYDTSDCGSAVVGMPSLLDVSPRSNDSDAYDDMFSTPKAATSSLGALCGMAMCLGSDDSPSSSYDLHYASHNMSRDIQSISNILGEPLRLVLDLKSRRVPPKVWSRLIDSMRSRGLVVEGIGSFDMDELRVIAKSCSCPLTPILFFHSVGDLQRACHANEVSTCFCSLTAPMAIAKADICTCFCFQVKKGDTVYFNGGSLMWKPSTIMEAAERGCCGCIETPGMDDEVDVLSDISINKPDKPKRSSSTGMYSFQPYAYPRASLSDWERVMCKSTLECYQKHFNLKVGVYVQGKRLAV